MASISVVVPHRGNSLGLWATLHSVVQDAATLEPEVVVVSNGEPLPLEAKECVKTLAKYCRVVHHHTDDALSPPAARAKGVEISSGEHLYFFDNHCLVEPGYFRRAQHDLSNLGIDILHSATRFNLGEQTHYHYKLKLDYNFWGESCCIAENDLKPYEIAVGGHGGFAVKRTAWERLGGYGPDSVLQGYGGEEVIFDMKAWMYGLRVHIDPLLVHYHYAGSRGYSRHYTDEYYTNMLACAHVIGGQRWLYKLFDSFITKNHIRMMAKQHMYDLLETAYHRSAEYAHEVATNSKQDLDNTLQWMRHNLVAM
jgi:hypothetical protein